MATATLSYNLNDLIGEDFDPRRTKVWITANVPLIVVDGTTIRLDNAPSQSPASDGTGSFTLVTTNSAVNPTAFAYTFHVDYALKGREGKREQWHSSEFTFTASKNIAQISQAFDGLAIPPNWQSEFMDAAEAIRDEAAAARDEAEALVISDLGTTDGQTRALVEAPTSQTAQALANTLVGQAKQIGGGIFPRPLRAPILVTEKAWPNRREDYRIMAHADEGQTLWAVGYDSTVRKSVDGGTTWTKQGYQAFGFNNSVGFLRTGVGTLLGFRPGSTAIVMRSTDDGVNWTSVTLPSARSGHYPMGSQSWAIDAVTGYIYYGEYTTTDNQTDLYVYRSTNDGASFSIFHTFPGYASASANKVRHVHSIQWDHVQGRIIVMTGDSDPAAGMYRVNAGGTALEPMLVNSNVPAFSDGARAIGIIPFNDHLCWTGDSSANPYLMRVARSELGTASPDVERVYRLNSTGWFTCCASTDKSRWVLSSSQEPGVRYDRSVHLYSVEDEGETVSEVAVLPTEATGLAALSPVNQPHENGDVFLLQTHNTPRPATWRLRLGLGNGGLAWPEDRQTVYLQQTFNSGSVSLSAGGLVVFGHYRVPSLCRGFRVLDAGVIAQSGDTAAARVGVRTKGGSTWYQSAIITERQSQHLEGGGVLFAKDDLASGTDIEFIIYSGGSSGAFVGTAWVTFGFA